LVISSKFTKKHCLKLKKIENTIYIRNIDRIFNKEGPIENIVEVNLYYKGYRKKIEIDIIREQKWVVILDIL